MAFLAFLLSDIIIFLQKRKKWKTHISINTVVSQKVLKLQRRTIPHFKALDQLFWPLAWLLTLGAMVFEVWCKISVQIIIEHPLLHKKGLGYSQALYDSAITVDSYTLKNHIIFQSWAWKKYENCIEDLTLIIRSFRQQLLVS